MKKKKNVYVVSTANNLLHLSFVYDVEYKTSSRSFAFEDNKGIIRHVNEGNYILFTPEWEFRAVITKEFFKENYETAKLARLWHGYYLLF